MDRISIATPAGTVSALQAGPRDFLGPRLHFAHATGMNAQLYEPVLAPLADRFAITISDARGHGHSGLDRDPAHLTSWEDFAHDLLRLIDVIDRGSAWVLAGHSMGATVSLLAAAMRPERVAGLVLLDPPMLPFDVAATVRAGASIPNPMADQAARRRGMFPSRAEARAAYQGRGVFRTWSDAHLDAYLAGGLIDTDEGVELACQPAFEAATFRAVSPNVEPALARLQRPFVLLAGAEGSTVRDAELAVFAAHPLCRSATRLPGTTHFLPLERPEAVRAAISSFSAAP
ncbi:alpha/beta hydrolase [Sandarakinorhabdus sp. AAP62]|uniref:alpha/beta fold hydrolase n=1 Tax=Sandarakinorhabdus sp. AAP62 TaxID=1248916 RepID=UPI00030BAD5D|nr:alpha/beta hydrolase [Sandarakinorhabdus sp. AAP62]